MNTKRAVLIAGIILVSFCLRTPLTAVGPLVSLIRADLGISNGLAGFLTTLPLLVFAAFSAVSSKLGGKIGNERSILIGLLILIAGVLLRSAGGTGALLAGTFFIGLGIVAGNVLIPSIIKQNFPDNVGIVTSAYSVSMFISGGLASGISIPLASSLHLGWRYTLDTSAGLILIALLIWLPQLRKHHHSAVSREADSPAASIWRSSLAWKVSLFLGLQSFLFYCVVAWLPAILQGYGISTATAGWMLTFYQICAIPASFIAPVFADRYSDQRGITAIVCLIYLSGMLIFLFGGGFSLLVLGIALIATGSGASISLAFTFIGLRTTSGRQASELSGMSQSVGYLLAAAGPALLGFLFDRFQTWTPSMILWVAATALLLYFGICAGKDRYVFTKEQSDLLKEE
ncbi:major facilitator superfamily MFS_1 [Syntrophobotulus glycolicus DSM 8271]|uniref:Major facilitator superfamily MFS_1 n=1 Tax=Syntrophobotulus glycolicus (strain DSM 8271 / FlGlyR) TaxID=645991 RepID=F0T0E8_SYNGF|nr:MFS transporter [Syntrophobotulus glycolicus]ADY57320.1 major facilitator superfamily MFS_1 [Syntrophobotulus glycolicus DSM 8271]